MTAVNVENFVFTFNASVTPFQYENGGVVVQGWPNGSKVVDVVANQLPEPPTVIWLLEAKDYRVITNPPKPANLTGLAATVDAKVRSTISGFTTVAAHSTDAAAKAHATAATNAGIRRVVLHLEPHPPNSNHSYLFPRGFSANVLIKLKQLVKDIDRNPLVLDIARTPNSAVPWSVI